MKKILVVLIMVFSLSLISCEKKENNENELNFINKDEINSLLTSFYIEVELCNIDGEIDSFKIAENNNLIHYQYKETNYLIDKSDDKLYSINEVDFVKLLEQQKEFDYQKNKNVIVDLLGEHIDIIDEEYQKKANAVDVNGINCVEYESLKKIDKNNYVKRVFYIDEGTGLCIKQLSETCSSGAVKSSSWEVKKLSFENNSISDYFNKFDNYEIEVAPLEFDAWPTFGLGVILPELTAGKFILGIDYGDNALISVNDLTITQVKNYIATLINYGFNEGKGATNVAGQYVYITYNSDLVMCRFSYTPSDYSLAIKIIKSTQDEIDKEMSKL